MKGGSRSRLGLHKDTHLREWLCVIVEENAELPVCKESRWQNLNNCANKSVEDAGSDASTSKKKRLPRKILRYFPLTHRLQRIYMSARVSSDMRWHEEGLAKDEKMCRPADSKACKHVDSKYEWFACDAHNIRLCLTSDGFNLFGMPNVTYTCWQVILIPYNLPPWLCHKQP